MRVTTSSPLPLTDHQEYGSPGVVAVRTASSSAAKPATSSGPNTSRTCR